MAAHSSSSSSATEVPALLPNDFTLADPPMFLPLLALVVCESLESSVAPLIPLYTETQSASIFFGLV
jgi:hypothetical protein